MNGGAVDGGVRFPLRLRLGGRLCLVLGGGEFAHWRGRALLDAGALVRLISPEATPVLEALAAGGHLRWDRRPYASGDLAQAW